MSNAPPSRMYLKQARKTGSALRSTPSRLNSLDRPMAVDVDILN